ncbi:hypothetical protein V5O48_000658 [Marasmius crinis-equi]|uniref:Uncharacterized protein n=1 Tax=Marasmius crinis-equi TaxID=585013 RepID=A0ABR3G0M4_9AGAR
MARATRSSVSSQTTTKKRKRNDDEDSTEQPPTKQAKSQDVPLDQPIFIQNDQAEKILAVLEMIDAQGLLDRVFPLPSDESRSFSFRTLLKECTEHPLSVLQSAVQNLFPISSHPRAPPSKPAAQQLRFCQLALSLLSQASTQSIRVHLDEVETLIPSEHTADEADDNPQSPPNHYLAPRYALVQHLPQGDYWTSLNSSAPSDNSRELKDLPHGHADLVAILPSARFSKPLSSIPTLGSYHTKVLPSYSKLPAPRIISRGSFLDYGPFASFAPTYEQDGTEVGRQELGEVYLARDERRKEKGKILKEWAENREKEKCLIAPGTTNEVDDVDMVEEIRNPASSENFEEELQELLPADEVESLKAALGCLDLELAVQELLNRNRRALERLQELQHRRLVAEGGGSSQVEEGSEEWDTASLRPRSSTGEHPPFVLVPKALHTLRRTLPLAPMSGWHGNLPPGRGTALRDDSTVKVRSGVSVPAVPVAAPIPTPAANTPAAPYNYSYYAQTPSQQMQYGRNGTTSTPTATYAVPYKPGGTFYPTPQQGSYYSAAQSYAAASAATGHQPYAHSGGWYSTYTPQIANAASTASTSSAAASTTPTPSYSSFFSAAATPAQRRSTLAVANTVAQNGWTVANGTTPVATNALTLPVHLRPNGQQSPFYGYTPPQTPIPATPAK